MHVTADIWADVPHEADADLIHELLTAALANYQATVTVELHRDSQED